MRVYCCVWGVCLCVHCCVCLSLCVSVCPHLCMWLSVCIYSILSVCLSPGTLCPRRLQAWSWLPYPLAPKAAFCSLPLAQAWRSIHRGRHSAQAEAVLQSAPEVTRGNADESESPVRTAPYLVPADARECHLIVRTIVTMSWAVTRAMGLLSLVDLYHSLPQWHPGGQHTLPAFGLPTPTP